MKILIVRFSSIGDIVLTTPVLRCIKNKYPHAEIHYLAKEEYKEVLVGNPYINKLIVFEGDLRDTVVELVKEKYDYLIDLQNSFRSMNVRAMLKQAANSRVKVYKVNKINFRKFLYTQFKINILPDKSIVDRYMDAVKKLGVVNDGQGLDYFIPQNEGIDLDDLPLSHSAGYISFVIGATKETKKMPVEKWKELCLKLDYPIILQGGKQDEKLGNELKKIDPIKIYNSCGKFTLNESADIIRNAKVVVTHDTGLMHIAAAFKRKIVSIWGNTTPNLGMYPYFGNNNLKVNVAPNSVFVENNNLRCRPCSKIGYAKCPKGHFRCMTTVDTNLVVGKIQDLLNK